MVRSCAVDAPAPRFGVLTPLTFVAGDALAVVGFTLLAVFLRDAVLPGLFRFDPFSPVKTYLSLWPALALLVGARAVFGLYPGYGMNPAEELRRQTLATLAVLFFVLAGATLFRFAEVYSRLVLGLAGAFTLLLLPLVRAGLKNLLARTRFYGESVWLLGTSKRAEELRRVLAAHPALGLKVVGQGERVPAPGVRAQHCLLVPEGLPGSRLPDLLDGLAERFGRVWLVPDLLEVSSVWVTPRDLQGHLALELKNNLLEPANRVLKRVLDVALVVLALPSLLLVCLLLALWLRLDSRGPVLFGQRRVGRRGAHFTAWKFRTMRPNAEREFAAYLAAHPEAEAEWTLKRKLRADPRVTAPGRLLRRLSLDELPQVWNVLRGEMSLVGPRPVMPDELAFYADKGHLYTRVRPGITGLWQVSGRSALSYGERVKLDSYYARNWSLWLDLVILSRTAVTVLRGRGAY